MLKFIRGKGQQPTAERQKLQKDLFAFRKVSKRPSERTSERERVTGRARAVFALGERRFSPTPGAMRAKWAREESEPRPGDVARLQFDQSDPTAVIEEGNSTRMNEYCSLS